MKIHSKNEIFPDDSKHLQIEENAFINSSLKEITIPASVSQLNEGWCSQILNLKINLNPNNQFYSNYENKFLLEKNSFLNFTEKIG